MLVRIGLLTLLLAGAAGCRNGRSSYSPGTSRVSPFDSAARDARDREQSKTISGDPNDDPFLRDAKAAEAPKKKSRPIDDDPVLDNAVAEEDRPAPLPGKKKTTPVKEERQQVKPQVSDETKYKALRKRIDAIHGLLSVETLRDGKTYHVKLEVPHPTDPELAKAFESDSAKELDALTAVTLEAEKWMTGTRRKVDPDEARADPFSP